MSSPASQIAASADAAHGERPQFSLKVIFAVTTWVAAIAALAVSQFSGWIMCAVGLSFVCLNCSGRFAALQRQPGQSRCFQAAWLLLGVSLFLPAMKGCNSTSIYGWEAARVCFQITFDPPPEISHQTSGYVLYCVCAASNVLLLLSPVFLWRLRRGKGRYYGLLLTATVPAMWCFGDPTQVLIGYYVWCVAGLAILCAFRMRWVMLPLLCIAPMLALFAHRGNHEGTAVPPPTVSAISIRSSP